MLTAPEPERDAEIEAQWTQDLSYLANIQVEPARPLSPSQVLKKTPPAENVGNHFLFSMRVPDTGRLLGYAEIRNIWWTHHSAWVAIRIGDAADRRQGYGWEALMLLLRYAFYELNLEHLVATIYEYNEPALLFFQQAGFTEEVRLRQALQRFGRRWDVIMLGLTRNEWERLIQASMQSDSNTEDRGGSDYDE